MLIKSQRQEIYSQSNGSAHHGKFLYVGVKERLETCVKQTGKQFEKFALNKSDVLSVQSFTDLENINNNDTQPVSMLNSFINASFMTQV